MLHLCAHLAVHKGRKNAERLSSAVHAIVGVPSEIASILRSQAARYEKGGAAMSGMRSCMRR